MEGESVVQALPSAKGNATHFKPNLCSPPLEEIRIVLLSIERMDDASRERIERTDWVWAAKLEYFCKVDPL